MRIHFLSISFFVKDSLRDAHELLYLISKLTGWISVGSLDGFLYSFSPAGDLKKFPKRAVMDSAIQDSPALHCSGSAVYISQTVVEGKINHGIGENTYISAMKPRNVIFTLLVPATGSIYWSESYPGDLHFL